MKIKGLEVSILKKKDHRYFNIRVETNLQSKHRFLKICKKLTESPSVDIDSLIFCLTSIKRTIESVNLQNTEGSTVQ